MNCQVLVPARFVVPNAVPGPVAQRQIEDLKEQLPLMDLQKAQQSVFGLLACFYVVLVSSARGGWRRSEELAPDVKVFPSLKG